MISASFNTQIKGHVHIQERENGKLLNVLLDKDNAIHNKNMAIALARGLANEPVDLGSGIGVHQIYKIKLGNGGSAVNGMNLITYLPPNITGAAADLYMPTYSEIIDEGQAGTPLENSVTYLDGVGETTVVICTATIAAGEPAGQDLTDSPPNPDPEAQFAFDELGLFTYDDKLLTHIIFSPILKTSNRELVITYSLTIQVS